MQNNWKKIILGLILMTVFLSENHVSAATKTPKRQELTTFMVRPKLTDENIGGKDLGYFKVKYTPKKQQVFAVEVYNPTTNPLTIKLSITDAITLDNGTVSYDHQATKKNSLLKQKGDSYLDYPSSIDLKPNQSKTIEIKTKNQVLKKFQGTKVMAIKFISDDSQYNQQEIKNEYVYQIGLSLVGKKLDPKKSATKPFKAEDIKLRVIKDKPAISYQIDNQIPYYFKDTTMTIKMVNTKWRYIKYDNVKKAMKIAPMSNFYNDLFMGGKRLVAGTYRVTISINDKGFKQKIHKYVAISKKEARFINKHNLLYLKYRNAIFIAVLLIISLLITLLFIKKKRKNIDKNA